jgi:hypothetical protein
MPAWKTIGQYMRWNAAVNTATDAFLRFTFGLDDAKAVPSYIGVHIRRGDFGSERSLGVYIEQVDSVRRQLNEATDGPFHGKASSLAVVVRSFDHFRPCY